MSERLFNIKAHSQDQYGVSKRTEYMESIIRDMKTKAFNDSAAQKFNMNLHETKQEDLPETEEELQLHMQLNYKQEVELAEEQAIDVLLKGNKYNLIRKRLIYDLTVLGLACVKTDFNWSEGVNIEYVDPANIVYSYTDSPYFEDIYYVGEVKSIPINELIKQFPELTQSELEDLVKNKSHHRTNHNSISTYNKEDNNTIQVLYFNYKTYKNEVYKINDTGTGSKKGFKK